MAEGKKKKSNQDDRKEQFDKELKQYLFDGLDISTEKLDELIAKHNLCLGCNTEVIKISDDGYLVIKFRFREFKKAFISRCETQK